MANKRMFSNAVIDSDAFLDMPLSAQALYFHLGLKADDDGFIGNPRRIRRNITASEDDLRLLVAKGFCLAFETGVFVIKDWLVHNTIRQDRYTPTIFVEEKKQLVITAGKTYSRDVASQHISITEARKRELSTMATNGYQTVAVDIDKDKGLDIDLVITNSKDISEELIEARMRARENNPDVYNFVYDKLEAGAMQSLMLNNGFKDRIPLYQKYVAALLQPYTPEEKDKLFCIDSVIFAQIFAGIWKSHEAGEEVKDLHRYIWVSISNFIKKLSS